MGKYFRYSPKNVLRTVEIFPEDPVNAAKYIKRKAGFKGRIKSPYKVRSHSALLRKIFTELMTAVFERVVEGHIFMFPAGSGAHIFVEKTPKEEVKYMRQRGLFKDFDLRASGYNIPRLAYNPGPRNEKKLMQIYIDKHLRATLYENARNGKIPYTTIMNKRRVYDSGFE